MLLRALILLLVTVLGCWPAWNLPELDGTEGRRVQIALEMLRNGDLLVPTLGGEPTWAKPPLHYWLLAGCQQWLGGGVLAMRLPSVLGLWLAALLAGELLRRWFGGRAGWVGALGIVCSPLAVATWPTAEIDPLFACLTAMSLFTLATGVARERGVLVLASGVLAGLAMLQKGPPFFLFAAGAYLAWWRHRRCRGGLLHFVPMLLVALAYFVPLWLWRVDPGEMLSVARGESVARFSPFAWKHLAATPEYWLRAVAVQLPFGLWCFWEWRGARDARINADDLMLRMCSGAAVVAIAVLTLSVDRPTRYLLPNVLLFPFAVAPAVAHFTLHPGPVPAFARRLLTLLVAAGGIALLVLPFLPRVGLGAMALAAVGALGARAVQRPVHVVVFILALPVVAAWTVLWDRSAAWRDSTRGRSQAAAVLQRELTALGVGSDADMRTAGHFDSPLLLGLGRLLPGNESGLRAWTARWVLHECTGAIELPPDYRERLRLHLPFKSFALRERHEGK